METRKSQGKVREDYLLCVVENRKNLVKMFIEQNYRIILINEKKNVQKKYQLKLIPHLKQFASLIHLLYKNPNFQTQASRIESRI